MKLALPMMLTPGVIQADSAANLLLKQEHLGLPVIVTGMPGTGKSFLLQSISRQLFDQGIGQSLFDPHGDWADATFQYVATSGADPAKVHYLKPGADCSFRLDFFEDIPRGLHEYDYIQRLHTLNDNLIAGLLRTSSAADQDMQKRRKLSLRHIFFACGLRVDGEHLGLSMAPTLADPRRPEWDVCWDKISYALKQANPDAYHYLLRLRETKSESLRDKWIESSQTILGELFSSDAAKLIFGKNAAKTLSLRKLVLNSETLIVNLRPSPGLSTEVGSHIGGMLSTMLLATTAELAEELPFEKRVPHAFQIDELETMLSEPIRKSAAQHRKYRTIPILSFQDISCLARGDLDATERFFGCKGLLISLRQQGNESLDYLSQQFFWGGADTSHHFTEQVQPDGYDWLLSKSTSHGRTTGVSTSHTDTESRTNSHTLTRNTGTSINLGVSEALSRAVAEGFTESTSVGGSRGRSWGETWSDGTTESIQHTDTKGVTLSHQESDSVSEGENWSEGQTKSIGLSHQDTQSRGVTASASKGESDSAGTSHAVGHTENHGTSASASKSETVGATETHGTSRQEGASTSVSDTTNESNGRTAGTSRSESSGTSESENQGISRASKPGEVYHSENRSDGVGASQSSQSGTSTSESNSHSTSHGKSVSTGSNSSVGENHSVGQSQTEGTSTTAGTSHGTGSSETDGTNSSHATNASRGLALTANNGVSDGCNVTEGVNTGRGGSRTDGHTTGTGEARNNGTSVGTGSGTSHAVGGSLGGSQQENFSSGTALSRTQNLGSSRTESLGLALSDGTTKGESHGVSIGTADATAVSEGASFTESYQLLPLARQKIVERDEGRFHRPIEEQIAELKNMLAKLPNRFAMVKCVGMDVPFVIKVHDVIDPWELRKKGYLTPAWREDDVRRFLEKVHAAHGYYFDPREVRRGIDARTKLKPNAKRRPQRELVGAADEGVMG